MDKPQSNVEQLAGTINALIAGALCLAALVAVLRAFNCL